MLGNNLSVIAILDLSGRGNPLLPARLRSLFRALAKNLAPRDDEKKKCD